MKRPVRFALVAGALLFATSDDARADLVFFTSGRSMSVRSVREAGDELVLTLRGGGEIRCERRLVADITPDEVEPEPESEPDLDLASELVDAPSLDESAAGGVRGRLAVNPPYAGLIDRTAQRHGLDPRLVRAVVQVESAYRPRARSRKGARGLMQLMPSTARQYAVGNAYDPVANLEAGVRHLRGLLERLPLDLALAAYNAGEASVVRYQGIPPYPETQTYVARILKLFQARTDTP